MVMYGDLNFHVTDTGGRNCCSSPSGFIRGRVDMACSGMAGEADREPCFFNFVDLRIPGGQPLQVPGTVGAATVGVLRSGSGQGGTEPFLFLQALPTLS
jgi:hypothetical protein